MALTQSHYRFGVAELLEATHGWLAAEDKPIMLPPARPFLLRFCVQADATGLVNVDNEFQFRQTRGGSVLVDWTNITTSSSVVRTGSTTVFTNGQNCTKRLSGAGTFESSAAGCTHDGTSGGTANDIVANGNSETEIGLQILGADTAIGDVIEFRLTRDGGTLLDSYAVIASLTVALEVFPIATRQPGVLGPSEKTIPSGAAGKQWRVVTDIAQAKLDDPTVAFDLRMYLQNSDTSWPTPDWGVHDEFAGCTFVGGPNKGRGGAPTNPPGWMTNGDEIAGKNVRFYLNNTGIAFDAGLNAANV